jgi:hypothetical protein
MSYFQTRPKDALRFLFFLCLFVAHGYYYGSDPLNNIFLTFNYFCMTVFLLIAFLIINIIRKFFRYTSMIFIRDDIEGAYSRSVEFAYKINKFLYFSNWWIIIFTYVVMYPFAINLNNLRKNDSK